MPEADITPLVQIMRQLRDKQTGCPWDIKQDFASIAPYTIEEAYEVADAIERQDMDALKEELGDLLLQVIFHSQMAGEQGLFNLKEVVEGICNKMQRRHPHIYGENSAKDADTVKANWEEIKEAERSAKLSDNSAMAGVAVALPAILRAEKLQKRAARTGFDWPDETGPIAKIHEELNELSEAASEEEKAEELGDLLFAVVNLARHKGINAEAALKAANQKFEKRFRTMELNSDSPFEDLSLNAKEELWRRSKQS